jgi:hypothetical protein
MGRKKKSRIRQKLPILKTSGLPIQTLDWGYEIPEMFLILSLLEDRTAEDVVNLLANLQVELRRFSNFEPCQAFTGRISELGKCLESDTHFAEKIKTRIAEVFTGANAALLRRFDIPGKAVALDAIHLPVANPIEDYKQIMRVVARSFDGRGGRATRAKLVHLFLLKPELRGFHSLNAENLAPMLTAKDDALPQDATPGQVRASWGALRGMKGGALSEWSLNFWLQGSRETPCMRPAEEVAVDTVEPDAELAHIVDEIDRLWRSVVMDEPRHDIPSVASVTLGLGGRVWRMMHHIIDLSRAGNGEMAEIALRCQCDSHFTMLWLLKQNDPRLFQSFVEYSSGKDKALLEYVRAMEDKKDPKSKTYKSSMEKELSADIWSEGIWEQLVAEERGAWTNATAHDMAKETGREHTYKIVFSRASDIVHGSWRALKRYHLQKCLNPLHKFHSIPYSGPTHDAGLTPVVWGIMHAMEALSAIVHIVCESGSPHIGGAEKLIELFQSVVSSRSAQEGFRKTKGTEDADKDADAGSGKA